jgi:predicted Zn-dependent protease
VPALLCAGWLAGRGPLVARPARRSAAALAATGDAPAPAAAGAPPALPVLGIAGALAVAALATAAAWTTWQPERAVTETDAALVAVEGNRIDDARADVRDGRAADPLSLTPLFTAATVEVAAGNVAEARRLHEAAVRQAPSSPEPWLQLAQFELDQNDPRAALRALGPALYLDPRSTTVQRVYLLASRAETQRRADAAAKRRASARRSKKNG